MAAVDRSLKGQSALITGAAQGIGLAIAHAVAADGAFVTIADIQDETGERAAAAIRKAGGMASFVHADVGDEQEVQRLVQVSSAAQKRLDILVNSATPSRRYRPEEAKSVARWDAEMNIMLRGSMTAIRAAAPHLAAAKGVVINISSVLARSIAHESCGYHVAKAGLEHMTRYFAYELGRDGVRVNAVAPGLVDRTQGVKLTDEPVNRQVVEMVVPLKRAATAQEIARIVAFLCSADASYVTGQTIVVDGGLSLSEPFGLGRRAFLAASLS